MINLLPSDNLKQLKASMVNNVIAKYIFLLVVVLSAILVSTGIIFLAVIQTKSSLESQLQTAKQQADAFSDIKTKSEALRSDLKLAESIINSQVNYSKLLTAFSALLPSNVQIQSIAINNQTIKNPKTIQITAPNYQKVIDTKTSMLASPLIKEVSINSMVNEDGRTKATIGFTFDPKGLEEVIK